MPIVRMEFEALKQSLNEGRLPAAASALFGECLDWGRRLAAILVADAPGALADRDTLTRFFVARARGQGLESDLAAQEPAHLFILAFSAFSYLDPLMDEASVGDFMGDLPDGTWLVSRVVAGEVDGAPLRLMLQDGRWRFDLMALYRAKAQAMADFIAQSFDNDFDAFLWRYVAEHDLEFDMERARRPQGE